MAIPAIFQLPRQTPLQLGVTVPGAKAQFYAAGTTTPQAVYTTAELDTQHSNPVEADAAGLFPVIYLDDELAYRVQIKTSGDVLIYDQDDINDPNARAPFYDTTAAEDSAGVTPADKTYLSGRILRYGANTTPGTTDMASALQNAFDGGAPVVQAENDTYYLGSDVTCDRDVVFEGNNALFTGPGRIVFAGSSANVGEVGSAADIGDVTITASAVGSIETHSLIRIRSTTDNSFSPYNASHRKGEFKRVIGVSGSDITVSSGLEEAYSASSSSLIDLISPIKVIARNFTVLTTSADSAVRLQYCSESRLENVAGIGGALRGIEVNDCHDTVFANCVGICLASSTGFQYGISIADSQNCHAIGGYYHGTRHGSTMGTSGRMPTRHCTVRDAELSNSATNSGAADFHSSVADSRYINCRIHNTCKLAGRNNKFVDCKITARRNDYVLGYLEPNGGTLGYYNCRVDFYEDFNFSGVMADITGTDTRDQDVDTTIEFVDIDIAGPASSSPLTRIHSAVIAQDGTVDLSFVHRNIRLTGDLSSITEYMTLQILTSTNPGGHGTAPAAPDRIEIVNIISSLGSGLTKVNTAAGDSSATTFAFPNSSGTFDPTYTTTGTGFDSVTYSSAREGKWRRVDDMVFIEGLVDTDSITVGSASGNILIGGLPFTVADTIGGISLGGASGFTGEEPLELRPNGSSKALAVLYRSAVDGNSTSLVVADMDTSTSNANRIWFSGWYITSDS